MNLKMFKNDLKRNPVGNLALILFMSLSAFLVVAATIIVVQLTSSISGMYEVAQPPHFLQMHKGEIDQEKIDSFNQSYDGVIAWQTSPMINVYGSDLSIEGKESFSLSESRLDISLVKQNAEYDLLLDGNRNILRLNKGEIGIPMVLLSTYDVNLGDTVMLKSNGIIKNFIVKTFVHDAQMNSTLVYSTRMLVSDFDFDEMFGNVGETEYLIETYFDDKSMVSQYQSAYENANLPQSGPAITYNMIFLLSAFTDIILAIMIILVSTLLLVVALLSIKYTLMATLEEEISEIGTMKAIGMTYKDIRNLYLNKYKVLIGIGLLVGAVLAFSFSNIFTDHINQTFGKEPLSILSFLLPLLACLLLYLMSIHYSKKTLKKIKKLTIVDALVLEKGFDNKNRVHDGFHKFKNIPVNFLMGSREIIYNFKSYILIFMSMIFISSMILVPTNLSNTLKSKDFIPYMGAQLADIFIEIDLGEKLEKRFDIFDKIVSSDIDIESYHVEKIVRTETKNSDDEWMNLRVSTGNDSGEGLMYLSGKAPTGKQEIAISKLNANEIDKELKDEIVLRFEGKEVSFIISGIYQDVTSGGFSAKSIFDFDNLKAEKYEISIDLKEGINLDDKVSLWTQELGNGYKIQSMEALVQQTLGVVSDQIQKASNFVWGMGLIVLTFIFLLFMQLRLIKDASEIAGIKAIGFNDQDVKKQYLYKIGIVSILGIYTGIVFSNFFGEKLISGVFSVMGLGISKLKFIINPWIAFLIVPLVLIILGLSMTWFSLRNIHKTKIISFINE